jgi:hypothetical protein
MEIAVLSIITGGGKWVSSACTPIRCPNTFCSPRKEVRRCVQSGEGPGVRGRAAIATAEAVRTDMSASNSWAEFAAVFRRPGRPTET